METLGSLCDKLTIVKLKQWHSDDKSRLESLAIQSRQLSAEIDDYIKSAVSGDTSIDRLQFAANKVYRKAGNEIREMTGVTIGVMVAELAAVNCALWHEQEKVYEFESIMPEQKNSVVKNLARMNLERTSCIDRIDSILASVITDGLSAK